MIEERNPLPVNAVANRILTLAHENGVTITNLRLQKLLYFASGFFYVSKKDRLFFGLMEAWDFGPVSPEIYYQFQHFGQNPITEKSYYYRPGMESPVLLDINQDKYREEYEIITATFLSLGGKNLFTLTKDSCILGSPWCNFYSEGKLSQIEINDTHIDYFKKIMIELMDEKVE